MRNKFLCAAIFALAAPAASAAGWNDPQEPFALYGNTWYVGVRGLSSVLITSPEGHILIDGGSPDSPKQIVQQLIESGASLSVGGFGLCGIPSVLIAGLLAVAAALLATPGGRDLVERVGEAWPW